MIYKCWIWLIPLTTQHQQLFKPRISGCPDRNDCVAMGRTTRVLGAEAIWGRAEVAAAEGRPDRVAPLAGAASALIGSKCTI